MSLRQGLRALGRNVLAAKSLPERAGAGAPVKYAPRPDKPLPLWYDLWWDNGVFPGQPAVDYMIGPLPANVTMIWYAKMWAIMFGIFGSYIGYYSLFVDEFRQPFVPQQYPPEVRHVLVLRRNNNQRYDFSAPDYDFQRARVDKKIWSHIA